MAEPTAAGREHSPAEVATGCSNRDGVSAADLQDSFDIAVVVLVRANGVDHSDAVARAERALTRALREPLPHMEGTVDELVVEVVQVREVGAAAGGRLLKIVPTEYAFRE